MSEYQYYEFQAIDRPLTKAGMTELRAISSRAHITPTRFQNVYSWGDFRGDLLTLMERYFDVFVYVANWGTHRFMLRLPRRALDVEMVRRYCVDDYVTLHVNGDHLILAFRVEDEEGSGWVEDAEAEGWLPALLPIRAELAMGDLRSLYLAWLACTQSEMLDDEAVEPPLPPGLGNLSASLEALAEFLDVDRDLIAVAAERSADLQASPPSANLAEWIRALPESEKDDLLRLADGEDRYLRAELLRRSGAATAGGSVAAGKRTVQELLAEATDQANRRRRQEAEREAAERARQDRERAAARAQYLDSLVGREEELWRQVEALVEIKQAKEYDQATQLLKDLHDVGARQQRTAAFAARLALLRERYAKRVSFLARLDRAGLRI